MNPRPRRTVLALAIAGALSALGLLGAASPALAQTAAMPAAAVRSFDIPAGPLNAALQRFVAETGVLLSADGALTAGRTSPGVEGSLPASDALQRLLAGTGLATTVLPGGAFALRAAPEAASAPAAVSTAAAGVAASDVALPAVRVQASADALPGDAPKAFAGGQVARGGRLGLLGDVDYMETPFSISSFTAELVRDKQITELRDLIKLDPSAANGAPRTYSMGGLSLRGFSAVQRFAGLKILGGVWGGPDLQTDVYDRIEIVKGASAVLNGGFDGLGGTVNLVPKRADDIPLTRLTARAESQSLLGGHVDIGRRFGVDHEFGIRANASGIQGEAAIDDEKRRYWLGSLALDYRGERVRASVDLIAQHNEIKGIQNFYAGSLYTVASGAVPSPQNVSAGVNSKYDAPKNRKHYAEARGFAAQFEADLTEATTLRAARGRIADVYNAVWHTYLPASSTPTTDAYEAGLGASRYAYEGSTASLTHQLDAGGLRHRISLAYDAANFDYAGGPGSTLNYTLPAGQFDGAPDPGFVSRGGYVSFYRTNEHGIGLGDSFGPRDDRWRIVAGVRRQKAGVASDWDGTAFSDSATSLSLGGLVKLDKPMAVYANYAEGLEAGSVVPRTDGISSVYDNAGEVIPPFRTRQYEVGLKLDWDKVGASAALFQLARPSVITTRINATTLHQSVDGEQRNRGLELSVFGEPLNGLRLLAGLALIDPKLTQTAGGANDGNVAPNTARRNVSLSADWDLPGVRGLTLNSGLIYKSRQFVDGTNAAWIKPYTTVDLGLIYKLPTARPARLALNVLNVFDLDHWASNGTYGDPRTVKLAASVDF